MAQVRLSAKAGPGEFDYIALQLVSCSRYGEETLSCSRACPGVVFQPATIPPVPLERRKVLSKVEGPHILNIWHWAAPEDSLSNTLHLLGLRGAPIDIMGASNMLRRNLGYGSVRPSPDRPVKTQF